MELYTVPQADGSGAMYPAHAWPGGYPMLYYTADGGILCPACANGCNGSDAGSKHPDPQWLLVGCDIHWEGMSIACDHCNRSIDSAYGEV